ncbi:MAG: PAS domain S-box protein, partial [Verrucomicrobia bacterium]|nr:PAS domain S-box protein [Verrucomicrobiota bacterium]
EHIDALSPETMRTILHELRVHQIELEMQNEELRRAEAEADTSRARYFDLYDLAPVGYLTVSERGLILEANLTAATLLGLGRGKLVKQPISRIILKEDQNTYYKHRQQLFEAGEPQKCELRLVKADGSTFWAQLSSTATQSPDGEPACRVVLSDITDRKQAQAYREIDGEVIQIFLHSEDLQGSIQRTLATLKERTGFDAVGIRLQDGDDFPYFVQEGFPEGFLLKENSLLSRTADGGICRDQGGNVCLECTCGLVISGQTDPANPLFTRGGSCWTNDSFTLLGIPPGEDPRHHPRNQCIHHGFASVALIPIRIQERITGLVQFNDRRKDRFTLETVEILEGIAEHIGEAIMRKKMEEALQESENRMRAITDSAQDAILMMDPEGRICYWNAAAELIFGYTSGQALGKNLHALITPARYHEAHHAAFPAFLKTGSGNAIGKTLDMEALREDGSEISVQLSLSSVQVHGAWHAVGIIRDISERKTMDAALKEALRHAEAAAVAKSEFLGVMSHELRTPLNGVLGFAELLADTPLNDEQKSFAKTISSSGEHLLAIVNDILDLSSIEHGAMAILPDQIDLAELVESSDVAIRQAAAEKGIEFRCEVADGVPGKITADERRLRQILLNLLGNAVKFTASGSVVFRIMPDAEGRFLDFSIEDTGIGISPETLPRLFKPFTQANSTTSRRFGGTGLGLVISKRIAEAMGGTLTVTSTPDKGSTFTFRLPLEISVPSASPAAPTPCDPASTPPSGLVLVADDEQNSTVLAGKMLQSLGYRAEFAADGAKALKAFEPGKFSAILMDMAMPVMDGLEATAKIRDAEAGTECRTPIIAFTANVMPGDRERCLAAGMDDFLPKPFKRAELAAKIACAAHR